MILTEDEIVAYATRDSEYCQLSVDVGMWAGKEQLKRVAGEFNSIRSRKSKSNMSSQGQGLDGFSLLANYESIIDWLNKEAGI